MKKLMLERTDVFVFEEIGLLSAEYFTALDNILRSLMKTSLAFGGKLLLSCGDSKQLPPIDGRPIWASVYLATMFIIYNFRADVRASDENLRWINSECRRELQPAECIAVAERLVAKCQFKETWKDVPAVAVRIVSTKAAEFKVMNEFLEQRTTTSYAAVDEVQNATVWDNAADRISKSLNSSCYEYDVCKLYCGAVVRMTYNKKDGAVPFSQGQVAIVVELPSLTVGVSEQRLRLRLAPPGERVLDVNVNNIPDEWKEVVVGRRTTPPIIVGRYLQMGRRTQFPVRYYLASTIHRIQGDTVGLLATELSLTKKEYRLWQKEQFTVLISRVHKCDEIIFVGSKTDTQAAIVQILSGSSKWDTLVDHYLSELDSAQYSPVARNIRMDSHPFLPMYRELPAAACGYVYLIASLSTAKRHFIGHTMELKKALREHNTGYGSEQTRNTHLHPWGVYAFVIGFDIENRETAKDLRAEFASDWRYKVEPHDALDSVFEAGKVLADVWKGRGFDMTIVKCGQQSNAQPAAV
jgi:predicted GIY-YIG superfamily endonuclease